MKMKIKIGKKNKFNNVNIGNNNIINEDKNNKSNIIIDIIVGIIVAVIGTIIIKLLKI